MNSVFLANSRLKPLPQHSCGSGFSRECGGGVAFWILLAGSQSPAGRAPTGGSCFGSHSTAPVAAVRQIPRPPVGAALAANGVEGWGSGYCWQGRNRPLGGLLQEVRVLAVCRLPVLSARFLLLTL
jgi:hypothetical protein